MKITLITGGNKGLGYETARRLKELGHKVYIGARNEEKGKKAANELGVEFILLDVTDDDSVANAAKYIADKEGHLDVLINNAGTSGNFIAPESTTADDIKYVYEANVFGIVRMTKEFIPIMKKSDCPVIVNVSSGLGSFGMVLDDSTLESKVNNIPYCSSKSAVTMITLQYAKALPDFHINAADPGATNTDLNGGRGHQTVTEGTDAIVQLATLDKNGPTGTFINRDGQMPW